MQIKSFKAPTIALALEQVKRELGPNAIILGNRQVSVSPAESYYEVTAAVEPGASSSPSPSAQAAPGETQIESDIQEIKSFLSLLISSKDYSSQLREHGPVAEVYHGILTRGVEEKQAFMLLTKALATLTGKSPDKSRILEAFAREVLARVKLARPFQDLSSGSNGSPTGFVFLGPTGVGKTTTLAKLAAYLKIKRQFDVGLISIDTYRIGAVDQLQTYASIMEIPLVVAQNRAEFESAREKFRHRDVILVDTTGKNFLNRHHVEDLQSVFGEPEGLQPLLVLSATTKDEDLRQTILHFRNMNVHSLVFTKIDETMNHGSVINQLLRFPYPVSYFGTGQRVPEDIESATQKRLLSFLSPARR